VASGGSQIVKFDLNTEAAGDGGLLSVHSNLPRAMVSIDGAEVGTAPQERRRVSAGEHSVLVRLDGYKQFEQKVRVDPGQTATGRITGGAGSIPNLVPVDASVAVRTLFARTEIGLGMRATFVDNEPFSAGAFTNLWWGSKLLDDSKRNGVTWDVGALISLTAL